MDCIAPPSRGGDAIHQCPRADYWLLRAIFARAEPNPEPDRRRSRQRDGREVGGDVEVEAKRDVARSSSRELECFCAARRSVGAGVAVEDGGQLVFRGGGKSAANRV